MAAVQEYCSGISIHALREEGDARCIPWPTMGSNFYPRPPRGGRRGRPVYGVQINVFLSTPSARRATKEQVIGDVSFEFLSTPSARRATFPGCGSAPPRRNFYPRPPRGGRREHQLLREEPVEISIHALREEGDEVCGADRRVCEISIHALREEGDAIPILHGSAAAIFLSTPSARRATRWCRCISRSPSHFYPRPPRGGRRRRHLQCQAGQGISIHALREEGDAYFRLANYHLAQISIHALREEGDCGTGGTAPTITLFLSTPSARRATGGAGVFHALLHISIHALREEGDPLAGLPGNCLQNISIHALREEGDSKPFRAQGAAAPISIHALREEGDNGF